MVKKMVRSMMIGVVIFLMATAVGYLSYRVTYHYQKERVKESLLLQSRAEAQTVNGDAVPLAEEEWYIVRLENDTVAVYRVDDGKEAFLYSLAVRTGDLTEEDSQKLRRGMVLRSRNALTAFEEDFTS